MTDDHNLAAHLETETAVRSSPLYAAGIVIAALSAVLGVAALTVYVVAFVAWFAVDGATTGGWVAAIIATGCVIASLFTFAMANAAKRLIPVPYAE